MSIISHFDDEGRSCMVDVSNKDITYREAEATSSVYMQPFTLESIIDKKISKGDVFEVARIAGIMAVKKTSSLIPLCHPLQITGVNISFEIDKLKNLVKIYSKVKCHGVTGVEMEALVAVSIAALTIYDMCKGIDRGITITDTYLISKKGGKTGDYHRPLLNNGGNL